MKRMEKQMPLYEMSDQDLFLKVRDYIAHYLSDTESIVKKDLKSTQNSENFLRHYWGSLLSLALLNMVFVAYAEGWMK